MKRVFSRPVQKMYLITTRKDNLNRREKIVIAVIVAVLLAIVVAALFIMLKWPATSNEDVLRHNTLSLVRSYVDKEEFDRALGLLEDLLIRDPNDKDASE